MYPYPVLRALREEYLVRRWYRWAYRQALWFWGRYRWLDQDEVVSAAGIALWRAARDYEWGRQIPFCGFAKYKLRSEFSSCIRRHAQRLRLAESLSLERTSRDPETEEPEDLSWIWGVTQTHLSNREYELIVSHYRDGLTQQSLADRDGVSRQRTQKVIERALKKLRSLPELGTLMS